MALFIRRVRPSASMATKKAGDASMSVLWNCRSCSRLAPSVPPSDGRASSSSLRAPSLSISRGVGSVFLALRFMSGSLAFSMSRPGSGVRRIRSVQPLARRTCTSGREVCSCFTSSSPHFACAFPVSRPFRAARTCMAGTSSGESPWPYTAGMGHARAHDAPHADPPWLSLPTLQRVSPQAGLLPRLYQPGRQEAYSEPKRDAGGPFRLLGRRPGVHWPRFIRSLTTAHAVL